jgi:hypothetical protein
MQALLADGLTSDISRSTTPVDSLYTDGLEGYYGPFEARDVVMAISVGLIIFFGWDPASGLTPDGVNTIKPLYRDADLTPYVGLGRWIRLPSGSLPEDNLSILSTTPVPEADDIAVTSPIIIRFNQNIDAPTVNSESIIIEKEEGEDPIPPEEYHYRGCRVYLSANGGQTIGGSVQTVLSFDRIGYNIDSEFSLGSLPVTGITIPSTVSRIRVQGKIKIGSLTLPETTQYSLCLYKDGVLNLILLSGLFPAREGTPSIVIPFCSPPISVSEGDVYTLVLGIYVDSEETFETVGSNVFTPHDTTELHIEVLE